MSGQPKEFNVVMVLPTEPVTAQTPAIVVQDGDSITLKSYFHVDSTANPITRTYITGVLTGATASVEYHLQDLETGAMVPSISGGAISKLTAAEITAATASGGDLEGLPATGDYYLSANTAPITTGAAGTLSIAAASSSGTWRVLTHVHGGAGSLVSAFDDNLLIQVIT